MEPLPPLRSTAGAFVMMPVFVVVSGSDYVALFVVVNLGPCTSCADTVDEKNQTQKKDLRHQLIVE